jgi:hypothetical protein
MGMDHWWNATDGKIQVLTDKSVWLLLGHHKFHMHFLGTELGPLRWDSGVRLGTALNNNINISVNNQFTPHRRRCRVPAVYRHRLC